MNPDYLILNGISIIIVGFMIKKWMNQVDERLSRVEKTMIKIMVKMKIEEEDEDVN